MFRKKVKIILVIGALLVMAVILVNTGVINLDQTGQGKPESVVITDKTCYTTICDEGSKEMIIKDPKMMSALENAFFNKVQDVFHMTKESGNLTFTFNYERKTIVFEVRIEKDFTKGLIYYISRGSVFHLDQNGLKTLKILFDIQ